ncbi:hypothetical protein AMECASPLE_015228 [Ameca splendens]|uniref:Uncharacterized protein n=1 Tax=Ameca splendens TaxID=208324 RepID=A0ABV0ZLN2_9TELE
MSKCNTNHCHGMIHMCLLCLILKFVGSEIFKHNKKNKQLKHIRGHIFFHSTVDILSISMPPNSVIQATAFLAPIHITSCCINGFVPEPTVSPGAKPSCSQGILRVSDHIPSGRSSPSEADRPSQNLL